MNRPIEKCPKTGVYCSLCNQQGQECLAESGYDALLNFFYPHIQTLPIGLVCQPIRKDIQKVICRHVRRNHNRIRKEMKEL